MKLTKIQKKLRKQIITNAYKNNVSHIPSALSMIDYLYCFNNIIDYNKDCLVVGKPYGQLAYSTIWKNNNFSAISIDTKNVIWCDSTLGNCLGVAAGLALSGKYRNIFINLSDAVLQEGTILEALLFIGNMKYKQLSKIVIMIDYNGYQCISKTLITYKNSIQQLKAFGFDIQVCNGNSFKDLYSKFKVKNNRLLPLCFVFMTKKGAGIDYMENNPIYWHYKKLDVKAYKNAIKQLCVK